MMWSENRGIYQLVLKRTLIRTHDRMCIRTYERDIEDIIFDQGVRKYVRVTAIVIFKQVYVTEHICN